MMIASRSLRSSIGSMLRSAADVDAAAPGRVGAHDALDAVDDARRREVGPRHELDQVRDREPSGSSSTARHASMTSPRLCGGMFVAMPTAMPEEPLTSRFGIRVGSTDGSRSRLVVVRDEVDGLLVDVGEQLLRDPRHPHFGVAHRRGRIAVDRAEVALAVDEQVAHRERLGHAHDRVVDRRRRRAGGTYR